MAVHNLSNDDKPNGIYKMNQLGREVGKLKSDVDMCQVRLRVILNGKKKHEAAHGQWMAAMRKLSADMDDEMAIISRVLAHDVQLLQAEEISVRHRYDADMAIQRQGADLCKEHISELAAEAERLRTALCSARQAHDDKRMAYMILLRQYQRCKEEHNHPGIHRDTSSTKFTDNSKCVFAECE